LDANELDSEIEKALAEFHTQQEKLGQVTAKIREISVTETSPGRQLSVTVGPQGELAGLRFLNSDYQRMAAAELSALILRTVAKAREGAAAEMTKLIGPTMPFEVPADPLDFDFLGALKSLTQKQEGQ
jgi:DNA-binding protein YbaB